MDALDVLGRSVQHTHELLAARFDQASAMMRTPCQPRKGYEHIDTFLAIASKHLAAVDAALLPAVRRSVPDGSQLVHDYLRVARELELALAHVKAREYGSVFQAGRSWGSVWADVGEALVAQRRRERELVGRLAARLDHGALDDLTERLYRSEVSAPTRPHPYAPHTRLAGLVARKVMHAADLFWDTVEGRMVPEPVRPAHQHPGRLTQYLLADPWFDEEQPRS
ncbi:MAG: hypothetical protein JWO76_252 [Nocardioides sp.]|nr:hypothetical protein [Nocardioides sp.]